MKIAIIDMDNLKNPFWAAGQARATREVGKRLALKHDVTVYCSKYPGYRDYTEEGIKYVHEGIESKSPRLTNAAFILNIPLLLKKIKADVIIENFNAPISVSFAPLFTKIPVIGLPTMFNASEFSRKYKIPFHLVERIGMKYYKYLLPYSDLDRNKAKILNPNIICKIVPQGVAKEYLQLKKAKPKYILFLGRFDLAQKGIDLLIKAYSKVEKEIKYPLVIVGHGPDENKIKKLIKNLKLENKIYLVGAAYGEKKLKLMSEALFVAFPSRHDQMSLWSLEALAAGLPLVCFDLPESNWMKNNFSLKAKAFDIEEYSRLLVKATDPEVLSRMSSEARKFAQGHTWERVVRDFENFIRKILKNESNTNTREKIEKTNTSYLIEIPRVTDEAYLAFAESKKHIPFDIKRFYYIYDADENVIRGKHAHRKTKQILFCLKGKIKILLDNGADREEIILDRPNKGIFLDKMMWHEMANFKKDTILLILASDYYAEEDYIRNYDEFITLKRKRAFTFQSKNLIPSLARFTSFLNKIEWRNS